MALRTAVVGGGTISGRHLDGLSDCPYTDLVGICDVDADRARSVASEYGIANYTDMQELLDDANLDWVHICTPVATHLDLATMAIEAGVPLHRDLNGPQMETDWTVTAGWQKAF